MAIYSLYIFLKELEFYEFHLGFKDRKLKNMPILRSCIRREQRSDRGHQGQLHHRRGRRLQS